MICAKKSVELQVIIVEALIFKFSRLNSAIKTNLTDRRPISNIHSPVTDHQLRVVRLVRGQSNIFPP